MMKQVKQVVEVLEIKLFELIVTNTLNSHQS